MYSPTDINTSLSVKIASWLCGITRVNPNISHASVSVSIHVYQSSDNIRNRKNSMKMQHSASILCILWVCSLCFKNKNTTVKLLSLYFQILNEGIWGEKKDEKAYAAAGFIQFNFYCPPSYFIFTIFSSFFFFSSSGILTTKCLCPWPMERWSSIREKQVSGRMDSNKQFFQVNFF